ncbi:hypothetical protein [Actinomadura chokoriensis]|uniref:Uncharacterized protein n=1 Tax=Actinomadura chokoriensis TaxID=454156 RepID=A0ABV4QQZ3_9ACTN
MVIKERPGRISLGGNVRPGQGARKGSIRMDDVHGSEQVPVYHAEVAEWAVKLGGGVAPRLFALVRNDFGEDERGEEELVAYGIALPDGSAVTVPLRGRGFGWWLTPGSASRRTFSELVWLSSSK